MTLEDIAEAVGTVTDEQEQDDGTREVEWSGDTRDPEEYGGAWDAGRP